MLAGHQHRQFAGVPHMFWVPSPPTSLKPSARSVRRTRPTLKQADEDSTPKTGSTTSVKGSSRISSGKKDCNPLCTDILHKLLGAARRGDLQDVHKYCYQLSLCQIDAHTARTAHTAHTAVLADVMSRKLRHPDVHLSGSRAYLSKMGRYFFMGRTNVQDDSLRPYFKHEDVYLYYLSRHGSWRESGMWCIGPNVGKAEGVLLCNTDDAPTPDRISQSWKVRAEGGTNSGTNSFMVESGVEVQVGPTRDLTSQRKDCFHSVQAEASQQPSISSSKPSTASSKQPFTASSSAGCPEGYMWVAQAKVQKCMKCGKAKTRGFQCTGGNGKGGCHQLCVTCHGASFDGKHPQQGTSALNPR
jgi:hypothetical protein